MQAIWWLALREIEYMSVDYWSGDANTQDLFDEFSGYENSFSDIECKIPGCIVCGTRPPRQCITREEAEDFDLSLLPPLDSGWLSNPDFNFGSVQGSDHEGRHACKIASAYACMQFIYIYIYIYTYKNMYIYIYIYPPPRLWRQ